MGSECMPCKQCNAMPCHACLLAVQARLDSLLERTEAIGSKTVETFEGRDDHLMYRSVRYGPVERQHSDLKYAPATFVWSLPPELCLLPSHAYCCFLTTECAHNI